MNRTYGKNSSGEDFAHDDDFLVLAKVNFGNLDASGVDTKTYIEGWSSGTSGSSDIYFLQTIYNDVL